jgi:ribulose-phosphate 3-epimerase
MADAGVDQYTFHVESCSDVPFVCRKVKEAGMKVRISGSASLFQTRF